MKTIKRMCFEIKKYWGYAVYSAKTELKAEVASSYLNWIWWVLEPLCLMLIYAFIFGVVFNGSEQYFPIFLFIGITLWNFFNGCVSVSVKCVKRNKGIISNVYIPKYILLLVQMLVHAFKMLVSFGIIIIMMLIYRVPISPMLAFVPLILLTLFVFTFAVSVHLMHFGVYIDDMAHIVRIVLRVLFYMTGIFFNIEKRMGGTPLKDLMGKILAQYNPTALIVISMRRVLLYGQKPHWVNLLALLVIAIFVSIWGIKRIYKYENSYAKTV